MQSLSLTGLGWQQPFQLHGCFTAPAAFISSHRAPSTVQGHLWSQMPLVPRSAGIIPGGMARQLLAGMGPGPVRSPAEPARAGPRLQSEAELRADSSARTAARACLPTPSGLPRAGLTGNEQEKASTLLQKVGSKRELFAVSSSFKYDL